MSEKPSQPVSVRKSDAKEPEGDASSPTRPRFVVYAATAMVLSAVSAIVVAIDVFLPSVKKWLTGQQEKSYQNALKTALKASSRQAALGKCDTSGLSKTDLKSCSDYQDDHANLAHTISRQQTGILVTIIVVALALGFVGYCVYKGRSWSRWGVIGLWILTSFTGLVVGISSVLSVGVSVPNAYKVPAFLAGLFFIAAVVLVNLRPSVEFFAAHRPPPMLGAGGRPGPRRRGMFSPGAFRGEMDRAAASTPAAKKAAQTRPADDAKPAADRARSKQRASSAAVSKGADLARTRAKAAAKSRRTDG